MRLLSIDPADPFLMTLAERVRDGTLWPDGRRPADPFALADVTIYLPTRRAARGLVDAFLALEGGPTVLPRIEALGDSEEDVPAGAVIGPLESRVVLAVLIRRWAGLLEGAAPEADARLLHPAAGPDAVRLADELLALMDQVETQEADWALLPGLVEAAELAEHWQITTEFLSIATELWPAHLAESGKVSGATARRIEAEAAAARVAEAKGPIIVAGSTGSMPATRRLIRAIAESPWGAVVLPGFDRAADADAWATLAAAADAPGHPQYGMHELVLSLGATPSDVARLAPAGTDDAPLLALMEAAPATPARTALVAAALRPAPGTHRWLADRAAIGDLEAALTEVTFLDAADEREEAAAIAVAMRESVALGESVALVTPHRALARRVSHILRRWELVVDDSAGDPMADTPGGILARLVATIAFGGSAADWLALLKHPLATFGDRLEAHHVRAAERVFRGPRLAPAAVVAALGEADATLGAMVAEALAPLKALSGQASVGTLAAAHRTALGLVGGSTEPVAATLEELAARHELTIPVGDWPSTFDALLSGLVVRAVPEHSEVRILGPLEGRLLSVEHAILAGLNEGTWPQSPDAGPWMSRGMMSAFGIELPERRIGLSAHDFVMAAHQPRVTLTRAGRAGGEPTVASRWWQRLLAFAGKAAEPALERGRRLAVLAAALDEHGAAPAPPRPQPVPPVAVRPRRFSVTEIGRLVRDPYAVYARRILGLAPLDDLEAEPTGGDRGDVIHTALHRWVAAGHHRAADAERRFIAIVAEVIAEKLPHAPDARALWGARLAWAAPAIAAAEALRPAAEAVTEASVEAEIAPGLTLRGRIDRVDLGAAGAEIIDYKTGSTPSQKEVTAFFEPQLPLEAALIRQGALEGVPADIALSALTYVALGVGRTAVDWRPVAGEDAGDLAAQCLARLRALLALYEQPETAYLSRARLQFSRGTDEDYDHLARTKEWLTG